MLDLGSLKLGIKVDSEEAQKELTNFKGQIKETTGNLKDNLVKGAKLAGAGLTALAGSAVAVTESTREYRTEQAKLKTAFETSGFSAKDATKTYEELNGILGDSGQAVEASNHLAKLCDTQKDLQKWTTISAGVYATFGDSLPIEGLTEASNETAKTGQVTGSLADALNWVGISEDDFNKKLSKCSNEQERNKLITKTLNQEYKKAGKEYKKNAKEVIGANNAQEKLRKTMSKFGKALEPTISSVKEFVAEGLDKLATFVTENQDKIDKCFDKVKEFGDFIKENKDIIISGLIGIGTGLAVFKTVSLISKAVTAFKGLQVALGGATVAQTLFNLVMSANPIILVVTLIAGLVAALVTFMVTNDKVKEKIKEVWDTIKKWVVNKVKGIINFFTETCPKFLNKGKEIFQKFWDGLKEKWSAIKTWIKELPSKMWSAIKEKANKLYEAGKELFEKLSLGLKEKWDTIKTWFSDKLKWIPEKISTTYSKVKSAGKKLITGLWDGLKEVWSDITSWVDDKVGWIVDKFKGAGGKAKEATKDGSHRNGLYSVPYDGYRAELHKGEMILTSSEANRYRDGYSKERTINNITVNNYSPKALNEVESARQFRKTQRELALGF